ncbi:hypothetical protein [Micromonospora echinospora]
MTLVHVTDLVKDYRLRTGPRRTGLWTSTTSAKTSSPGATTGTDGRRQPA